MEQLELAIAQLKRELPGLTLLENEPLAAHCSFRIGGPARAIAVPQDVSSLSHICCILKEHQLAPLLLGNGTNLLFPDEGLSRVLLISTEKLTKLFLLPDGAIYAEAGVSLSRLASFAQQHGLTGLEFASGIPGTLGGACRMNAGAYGGELKDVIESVVCYYLPAQALWELAAADCAFGYRQSRFSRVGGFVVLSAVLRLRQGESAEIAAKMRELNEKRRDKQPLELPSAGSAFKRPEGCFAAKLIEDCGLKGFRVGDAQVSEKHAGFVVNRGSATSHEVYALMEEVRRRVYEQTKIVLEPEIVILPPDYCLEDKGPQTPRHRVTFNDWSEAGQPDTPQ